jgi:hypothetical protein
MIITEAAEEFYQGAALSKPPSSLAPKSHKAGFKPPLLEAKLSL